MTDSLKCCDGFGERRANADLPRSCAACDVFARAPNDDTPIDDADGVLA